MAINKKVRRQKNSGFFVLPLDIPPNCWNSIVTADIPASRVEALRAVWEAVHRPVRDIAAAGLSQ